MNGVMGVMETCALSVLVKIGSFFFSLNSLNVQDIQIIKMFLFHLSVTKAQIQIEYK